MSSSRPRSQCDVCKALHCVCNNRTTFAPNTRQQGPPTSQQVDTDREQDSLRNLELLQQQHQQQIQQQRQTQIQQLQQRTQNPQLQRQILHQQLIQQQRQIQNQQLQRQIQHQQRIQQQQKQKQIQQQQQRQHQQIQQIQQQQEQQQVQGVIEKLRFNGRFGDAVPSDQAASTGQAEELKHLIQQLIRYELMPSDSKARHEELMNYIQQQEPAQQELIRAMQQLIHKEIMHQLLDQPSNEPQQQDMDRFVPELVHQEIMHHLQKQRAQQPEQEQHGNPQPPQQQNPP
ncbi:hypothetical protein QVD17_03182 [Tagetes erecta]|uniref:Uncharacterized protein n=1 Tax=Tagetes erecta TaxID=13708 RepID=A0AAD8LDV4_TARER|nr:hypothetical protein QVD17_03182 [Tagetes erecta]